MPDSAAAGRRLRILVVCGYHPYPPSWGAAMRVHQLLRQLAARHSVTLLCYDSGLGRVDDAPLRAVCDEVLTVPYVPLGGARRRLQQARSLLTGAPFHTASVFRPAMQEALTAQLRSGRFDVVQVESSSLFCLDFGTTVPLVIDEHNVESELLRRHAETEGSALRRWFNRVEASKVARLEDLAWNRAAACAVTSEREIGQVRDRAPATRVSAVPNGVDVDLFTPGTGPDPGVDAGDIVFTGRLDYRPNAEGIAWFLDEVLPLVRRGRPDARVTVVGNGAEADLAALRRDGVTVTGLVPDIRPYLAAAGCVVAPIRIGGGTRLKVLEALSAARPLVSTALGCEGIAVRDEEHLLVADPPEEFAAAVLRLLADPHTGRRLGRAGRALVAREYSWDESGRRLRQLYDQLPVTATATQAV